MRWRALVLGATLAACDRDETAPPVPPTPTPTHQPKPAPSPEIEALIGDLTSPSYEAAERAEAGLISLADAAEPFVQKALDPATNLELQIRAGRILSVIRFGRILGPVAGRIFALGGGIDGKLRALRGHRLSTDEDQLGAEDAALIAQALLGEAQSPDAKSRLLREIMDGRIFAAAGAITALLKDEAAGVRALAVEAMEELDLTRSAHNLIPLLADSSEPVALRARRAMLSLLGAKADDMILPHLKNSDPSVRRGAIRYLAEYSTRIPREQFTAMLVDKDPTVRATAVEALGRLGARPYADEVAALCDDRDPEVRMQAVRALGRLTAIGHIGRVAILLDDSDARVVLEAMTSLERIGVEPYLDKVADQVAHFDPMVAVKALEVIRRNDLHTRAKSVERLLSSEFPGLRASAANTLIQFRSVESLPALHRALETERDGDVREMIDAAVRLLEREKER